MDRPILIFEYSPWYILLCLLLGVGVSWLFYRYGTNNWSKRVNNSLFAIRTLLLFILAALLLSPILKYINNQVERPIVVVGVDNSISLAAVIDSTELSGVMQQLETEIGNIEDEGYSVRRIDFGIEQNELGAIRFDERTSNISGLMRRIEDQFDGRNLHSVVLVSDGIYNSGASPVYKRYNFNLYSVGLGDTIPKSDISLSNVSYNRISYQGNQFPIRATILNEGFVGNSTSVNLLRNGRVLESKQVEFSENRQLKDVDFQVDATEAGTQRYTVSITGLNGEYTLENNRRSIFIDVVEGKENIMVLSERPHPDIKALREAITRNSNYNFEVYIHGISERPETTDFDLIICHQCIGQEGFISALELDIENTPLWIMYGKQLPLNTLNLNDVARIQYLPGEFDAVTASTNTAFSNFEFSNELSGLMTEFPPLTVPFGDVVMEFDSEALLFQRVGSIQTNKPLMVIKNSDPRRAVILGEGIWRWKLHDYLRNDNHRLFTEMISRIVQYLSSRDNKQKLRVNPVESETTDQRVVLETEVYNDLFERIWDVPVTLTVRNEEGEVTEYNYALSDGNSRYQINGLKPGVYTYTARADTGSGTESANGQFVIRELQVEYLDLTADHSMLRTLSNDNNGRFFKETGIGELSQHLNAENAKGIIHSFESYDPLINLYWILVVLLVLATTEWVTRKFYGAY